MTYFNTGSIVIAASSSHLWAAPTTTYPIIIMSQEIPVFRTVRRLVWFVIFIITCITGLVIGIQSIYHLENYELGYTFDRYTGKIERLDRSGWFFKPIWRYSVHYPDLRPVQVSISANSRILNAKLVKFNPEGLETFVEWHGRDAGDSPNALHEILKSYAFNVNNGSDCPFLTIVDEMEQRTFTQPVAK